MLNKVQLIGNIGKQPEIRSTKDGKEIANFSLATSKKWRDKNGDKQDKTEWHKIVVFSEGLVSFIKQYIVKGSKVYIEGELCGRKWTDSDGKEQYTTEIVVSGFDGRLISLDVKGSNSAASHKKSVSGYDDLDDEVPF